MQILKNILVGFLVSFIGSIPLGYLNVVGFEVFQKFGLYETIFYLLGVIIVEFFVVYLTLIFANKLINNTKLIRFIEGFSMVFMFVLAFVFYSSGSVEHGNRTIFFNVFQNFFFTGMLLSGLNFIQIPFWLSWNLYLLNGKYIEVSKPKNYFYVFGTVMGTFFGMLTLILGLSLVSNQVDFLSKYLLNYIIPLVFIGLGIFQAVKFYKKYTK